MAERTSFWRTMVYLTSLGWMMALPIAGGVLLGRFLDSRLGTGFSWTLAMLGGGIGTATVEVVMGLRRVWRRM